MTHGLEGNTKLIDSGDYSNDCIINHDIAVIQTTVKKQWPMIRQTCIGIFIGLTIALVGIGHNVKSANTNDDTSIILKQREHDPARKTTNQYMASRKFKDQCDIYLARSSLPNVNGFGMFTTKALNAGDELLSSFDGPSIPIIDHEWARNRVVELEKDMLQWNEVFRNYWWARGIPDQVVYEGEQVYDFQVMFGNLPNHNCIIPSLEYRYPDPAYDDAILDPQDPGMGAISYHNGRIPRTYVDLPAGSEFFLDYGMCSREQLPDSHPAWLNFIAMRDDYEKAAALTVMLWESLNDKGLLKLDDDENKANEHIEEFTKAVDDTKIVLDLVPVNVEQLQRVMTNLVIPEDDQDRQAELKQELIMDRLAITTGSTPRDPIWIKENGLCLENLVPGKTTIPHAGRGAIAQFPIRKGEIVVPVTTIQLTNKDVLQMYDRKSEENLKKSGSQLLLNYCFGHPKSSLLLCPQTNVVLINHCSKKRPQNCGKGPNAKLRWASDWDTVSPDWLKMTIDEIGDKDHRGISMEVVALRDIEPHEEVYIDYGQHWDAAWKSHVANWEPPFRAENSLVSVTEANANKIDSLRKVFTNNLRSDYDFPAVFTGCAFWTTDTDEDEKWKNYTDWETWDDLQILETYGEDGGSIYRGDFSIHNDGVHWPCSIIREEQVGQTYTVRMWYFDLFEPQKWVENNLPRLITNYPRESIQFFHKPYRSDAHLKEAFRHPIGIPDEIMPSQWKNLD